MAREKRLSVDQVRQLVHSRGAQTAEFWRALGGEERPLMLATAEKVLASIKRGRGRPALDPDGSVELRIRATQDQAAKLDRVCKSSGWLDKRGEPIRARAVRAAVDALEE